MPMCGSHDGPTARDDHGVAASGRRWRSAFRRRWPRECVPRGPVDAGSERRSITGGWACGSTATARRVAVWAFVMVLAFSRHLFVRPVQPDGPSRLVTPMSPRAVLRQGSAAECDNLRTGWTSPTCTTTNQPLTPSWPAAPLVDPARARKAQKYEAPRGAYDDLYCGTRFGRAAGF